MDMETIDYMQGISIYKIHCTYLKFKLTESI